ncbi:hypothetical protein EIN_274230 [Entamoeba invadens IP1]|uniref:Uncharacterized protein n=1 Tax=Entamoeba invadens IP1 TaxID=370355 RepID=A0A0A1U7A0_ENTIV|nr:hypothetical protein EIN_274230 [Entamoeba invadens IP1]ELP87856.1 hypothetical protein EIN_274230 [Entamoeba invadens IP1]|eukprot:XP_004254627.1 hypothetical protein EIN_274230 [Entamoeba invadens IP1]
MVEEDKVNPFRDEYQAPASDDKTLSCSVKVLAILSTAFGFVGALVVFLLEKKNKYIKLVSCHSLVWHVVLDFLLILFALLMFCNHWFTYTLFALYFVAWIVFSIFLIVMAFFRAESGEAFMVPGVSILVEKLVYLI